MGTGVGVGGHPPLSGGPSIVPQYIGLLGSVQRKLAKNWGSMVANNTGGVGRGPLFNVETEKYAPRS